MIEKYYNKFFAIIPARGNPKELKIKIFYCIRINH